MFNEMLEWGSARHPVCQKKDVMWTQGLNHLIFCSCSWRREPRGIGPGLTLPGCPHIHPRAPGGLTGGHRTVRGARVMLVCRPGKSLNPYTCFQTSMTLKKNKSAFLFLVSMCPSSLLFLIVSTSLCFRTSVITRWKSSAAGRKDEGSAVAARRAAARTVPALWGTTAGTPARTVSWTVRP